jgi:hypothetical protein
LLRTSPMPHVTRHLFDIPTYELRRQCLLASRLEESWHKNRGNLKQLSDLSVDQRAHSVILLPGGEWIAVVTRDVSLCLHRIGEREPAAILSLQVGHPRLVMRVVIRTFFSSSHETLLLIRTISSLRFVYHTDDTSNAFRLKHALRVSFLFVYLVDTKAPFLRELVAYTSADAICTTSVGGDLLAYETRPGWGNMNVEPGVYHVRNIPRTPSEPLLEAVFSAGNPLVSTP